MCCVSLPYEYIIFEKDQNIHGKKMDRKQSLNNAYMNKERGWKLWKRIICREILLVILRSFFKGWFRQLVIMSFLKKYFKALNFKEEINSRIKILLYFRGNSNYDYLIGSGVLHKFPRKMKIFHTFMIDHFHSLKEPKQAFSWIRSNAFVKYLPKSIEKH